MKERTVFMKKSAPNDNLQKRIFAKNLNFYISKSNKQQNEVAKDLGFPPTTFNTWCVGKVMPKMGKVQALADYFGVLKSDLLEDKNKDDSLHISNIFPITTHKLPMLGEIACGKPIFMDENRDNYTMIGSNVEADFCLKAKGDSMVNARIMDGDIVFIRSQPEVENGEIAAVAIDDEATLKRFYRDEITQTVTLISENPIYAPMVFTKECQKNVYILGKAVAFQSDVK